MKEPGIAELAPQPITKGPCVQNPVPRSSEPQNLELQSLLPGTQEPNNTVWCGRAGHPRIP